MLNPAGIKGKKLDLRKRVKGPAGATIILIVAAVALVLALLMGRFLEGVEQASLDWRLRLRYAIKDNPGPSKNLVVLAIDNATIEKFGRYGAGQWIVRKPFIDQLLFFERFMDPSVLAYDIIFQEDLGEALKMPDERSLLLPTLEGIERELSLRRKAGAGILPVNTLLRMNLFSAKQASGHLAHRFASVVEKEQFDILLGYNLRGGSVDPQSVPVPGISVESTLDDNEGRDGRGRVIPYLEDVAIPSADVKFANMEDEDRYECSVNANLPGEVLFDYSYLGYLNCPRDEDGIVRRVPMVLGLEYGDSLADGLKERIFLPSFSLAACLLHLGMTFPLAEGDVEVLFGRHVIVNAPDKSQYRIPIDRRGNMLLNFSRRIRDFDSVSFASLARDPQRESMELMKRNAGLYAPFINGRIVMAGIVATGIDVGPCPIVSDTPLVLVQLTAVDNILNRSFLRQPPRATQRLIVALLFVSFTAVCLLERSSRLALISATFVGGYLLASYLGVHWNQAALPIVEPVIFILLCSFFVLTYRFFAEEVERGRIRAMFSTMVSDKVLTYLEDNPESFSLSGSNVEATVFFSDITGFSRISERLDPAELTSLLNSYMTPVTDKIMEYGGYVDKYIGDAVMAVWGAPYAQSDHAFKACVAALEQQELVAVLSREWKRKRGVTISVRMGINTGLVTAGNMGSSRKFQYTVLGDPVNVAARLEQENRVFGTGILIGGLTRDMIADRLATRPLGRVIVRGKTRAVEIHELLGRPSNVPASAIESAEILSLALSRFYRRQWNECEQVIRSAHADIQKQKPVDHLLRQTLVFKEHPPRDDWAGEYRSA